MIGGLLLLAMLQVPDSLVVRVAVPASQKSDTTIVLVEVGTDSLSAVLERARLANEAERALEVAIEACGCVDSGPPDWFYAGILALGSAGLWIWHKKDPPPGDDIDLVQTQTQESGGDTHHHDHGKPRRGSIEGGE